MITRPRASAGKLFNLAGLRPKRWNSPGNEVIVGVSDSGCGIPPENLKTVFEPFFTTNGDNGTGLGLWVVKGIVENLGGRIELIVQPLARPVRVSVSFFTLRHPPLG